MIRHLRTSLLLLALLLGHVACAATSRNSTYQNPIDIEIADPFIFREGDTYYLYGTASGSGSYVWTSNNLVDWQKHGYAFRRTTETWSRYDFWAPELFAHNGKYYLHFTTRSADRDRSRRRLVLAEGDSPLGPFKEIKAPWFDADRPIIDGHVFRDDDGQLYLYTVHLDVPPKYPCFEIHVRRLDENLNPATETTQCISPTQEWEGGLVNEGPFVLRRGDTYLLTWSANPYWERGYSVGVATAKSPLGPWTKSTEGPILKASDQVSGPGHHCFIESPDGTELFIAYHVHSDPQDGYAGRKLAIDRATYVDGPTPTLKIDGPTHLPQPLPSGSPPRRP